METRNHIFYHKSNLNMSPYLTHIMKNKKGCKTYYNILANTNGIVLPRRWFKEMGDIEENEYLIICKQLK